MRIASFNVENLFERPAALNQNGWSLGSGILSAYHDANSLLQEDQYTDAIKREILELFLHLGIYVRNDHGAVRRTMARTPHWARLRKNRGSFDREPRDDTQDVEIVAGGRGDWLGWVELVTEQVDEMATRMTAKVIKELDADVLAIIEAEDRPALVRFNRELLGGLYDHAMLVDGNDERGIDVGIMTKADFTIDSIVSHVDLRDAEGTVFSRDCAQYEIRTHDKPIYVLVNHFKSQSGGGAPKRFRQASAVREIADRLIAADKHVIVLGDLNEGPAADQPHATHLAPLYGGPLVEVYTLSRFDLGGRPGTYDSCGLANRLDYMFLSKSLVPHVKGGGIFRKGLWGTRTTRPKAWETYPEMASGRQQASDHGAVYIDLDIT